MKKFLFVLALLLSPSLTQANDMATLMGKDIDAISTISGKAKTAISTFMGGGVPVSAACADSSCSGFLVCQNFETATTGYDNSESWSTEAGTPAPAYTTTHLRGDQSLQLNSGDTIYYNMTDAGEIYGVVMVQTPAFQATGDLMFLKFWDSEYSTVGSLSIRAEDWGGDKRKVYLSNGSAEVQSTDTIAAINTTYYVWFYWKNGTGTDSGIAITTDTTAPVGWETSGSSGTAATDAAHVVALSINSWDIILDRILLKTTSIGTLCD